MDWWQFTISTECDDLQAKILEGVVQDGMKNLSESLGVEIHVETEKIKPKWLSKARNCDVPECEFPAEWIIEVSINGATTEFAACGGHQHDIAASAALASDVAWGDADIAVKQI